MSYLGALMAAHMKNLGAGYGSPSRMDGNLPLGLRIGSSILFDEMPFILAGAAGLLVTPPKVQTVESYGCINLGEFSLHRFYLNEGKRVLQVEVENGQPGAIHLYELRSEIFPSSKSEWSVWLPSYPDDPLDCYLIGFRQFDLMGTDGTFAATYQRTWPANDVAQVKPETFRETLYLTPTGTPFSVIHQAMRYARTPERPAALPASAEVPSEWLTLAASEYPDKAMVQIHVGLAIEQRHLTVATQAAA